MLHVHKVIKVNKMSICSQF